MLVVIERRRKCVGRARKSKRSKRVGGGSGSGGGGSGDGCYGGGMQEKPKGTS